MHDLQASRRVRRDSTAKAGRDALEIVVNDAPLLDHYTLMAFSSLSAAPANACYTLLALHLLAHSHESATDHETKDRKGQEKEKRRNAFDDVLCGMAIQNQCQTKQQRDHGQENT